MNMRTLKYILYLMLPVFLVFTSCEPKDEGKTEFNAPDPSSLSFEIIKVDTWNFKVVNKSNTVGIAKFYIDGALVSDKHDTISILQKKAGTYEVSMSLYTRGGMATASTQTFVVTADAPAPPFDYENDAFAKSLTKSASRIWITNPEVQGHFGVGPADAAGPSWWSANPFDKKDRPIYDDEFTFALANRVYNVNCNGFTHANHRGAEEGKTNGYYGDPIWSDANDDDVSVDDAKRGALKWSLETVVVNGVTKYKIVFDKPSAVLGYDAGSHNGDRIYEILDWKANESVSFRTLDHDGNYRYGIIMPKDLQAVVQFTIAMTATANENEYTAALSNVVLMPASLKIDKVTYDFGDGDAAVVVTKADSVLKHTYMRKGAFNLTVTVKSGSKEFVSTKSVNIANYHSSYVPYLLDAMVMYQDFGQTNLAPMDFDKSGNDGSVVVVSNPDASKYPNKSANVAKYTKINSEWANAFLKLPAGYRFNLTKQTTFKMLVYGKAGDVVLLKLENTDRGGDAWKTGAERTYTIQKTNTWEVATYNFSGVSAGWNGSGDIWASDITTDSRFNEVFYNVIRIMYKPGDNKATYSFYFDDIAGPHVEGLK